MLSKCHFVHFSHYKEGPWRCYSLAVSQLFLWQFLKQKGKREKKKLGECVPGAERRLEAHAKVLWHC